MVARTELGDRVAWIYHDPLSNYLGVHEKGHLRLGVHEVGPLQLGELEAALCRSGAHVLLDVQLHSFGLYDVG